MLCAKNDLLAPKKRMKAKDIRASVPVAVGLLLIMIFSVSLEWRGIDWMNGYGPKPNHSFNIDDNRFVDAAQEFKRPELNKVGYPEGMTTQLFLVATAAEKLLGLEVNYPAALRGISVIWAQFALLITFFLGRWFGLSSPAALLSAFFLAVSPLFVLLANQGTPDVAALGLFYATVLAAMEANRRNSSQLFYATCFFAGICLAVKFLIPAVVPVLILVLRSDTSRMLERAFLAACIGLTSFCAANFFNFTPWDFWRLLKMLVFDNVIIVGGKSPPQQVALYARDLLAATGLVTSIPALVFLVGRMIRRASVWRHNLAEISNLRPVTATRMIWTWTGQPAALLVLPLLAHLFLIFTAQIHAMRHILVCVPLMCVAAAAMFDQLAWRRFGLLRKCGAVLTLSALVLWGVANAWMTAYPYWHDIRMDMVKYLRKNAAPTTTHYFYAHVEGSTLISTNPESDRYVTCDGDYARYLANTDASQVWHGIGGQERVDFLHALFEGRTSYRPVLVLERERLSLEDRLAGKKWLEDLSAFYATKCVIFERRS